MSASGLSRASSGKRASFMDPTASSAVKEREKVTPSRQPSARSNVSAVPTTAGGSSPRTDNAKTIESFLQDARNAVGLGSPGAGSPGVSPRLGSRAQSPSSPGPRGARSRSVSPGRAERTPNGAASSTTLRWNAPLPGDTLAATRPRSPASPGTPAVFSAGSLGADGSVVGGFGAFGSYAGVADLGMRATHARFDVSLDPALRFGVKNLGGNPAVATSILPTSFRDGFSGAAFGDVFSRERAASVTAFREAALMRDQIRVEGTRGVGVDDRAAKETIKRLESVIEELASEVRAFASGAKKKRDDRRDETTEQETTEPVHENENENENVPPGGLGSSRPGSRGSGSGRDSLREADRNRGSANALIRAAARNASREKFLSEAGAEEVRSLFSVQKVPSGSGFGSGSFSGPGSGTGGAKDSDDDTTRSVEADADLRRAGADVTGRYLRTTRRDIEAARYARGLRHHSGSAASQFWGDGRGPVLGGGAVGGGIDGADDDGVEDVDEIDRDAKQRRDEDRRQRNENARGSSRRDDGSVGGGFGDGFGDDAAAAFAAALSALDERRAARPDPAAEIARLKERNRALRRELSVAQRLMTGYHAQLMTGGAAERFATAKNAAYANTNPPPIPSYAARRAFVRRPFSFAAPASLDPMPFRKKTVFSKENSFSTAPMAGLRSTRRAERKRTAAELATLRAERALAETAADLDEDEDECSAENAFFDGPFFDEHDASSSAALGDDGASRDVARIARDVAALKDTVAGLVGRMDADAERDKKRERSRDEEKERSRENALDVSADVSASRSPAAPASEISFGALRDLPPSRSPRSRANEHEHVLDSETVADVATSPGMSLETDTAFLRTPAKTTESPSGGGEVESERVDTPIGNVA